MNEPYEPHFPHETRKGEWKPVSQVMFFTCDYCHLPKLKREVEKRGLRCAVSCGSECPWRRSELLPLIEDAQIKECFNGERRPPRDIVDYGAIVEAALPWLRTCS